MSDEFEVKTNRDRMELLVNHVFLPPKLPQKEESGSESMHECLVQLLRVAAKDYELNANKSLEKEKMGVVFNMLSSYLDIGDTNYARNLKKRFKAMKPGDVLALHISAQNAGLIVRRTMEEFVFEAFEASPIAASVMASDGRLLCSYPGPIVAVSTEKVLHPDFLGSLTSFLESMTLFPVTQAVPIVKKAGSSVPEIRDTTDPMFIVGMLAGILRGIGRGIGITTPDDKGKSDHRIEKCIRDDVLWHKARAPWRRSPFWLVLRVALQTTLKTGTDHTLYKSFMIYFMANTLGMGLYIRHKHTSTKGVEGFPIKDETLFFMGAKLGRRVQKADRNGLPRFVMSNATIFTKKLSEELEISWEKVQADQIPPNKWNPTSLNFSDDTQLSLHDSKLYLEAVLNRKADNQAPADFQPTERRRISAKETEIPSLSQCTASFEGYLSVSDFENWVEHKLDTWVNHMKGKEESCEDIERAIGQYTDAAIMLYSKSPENMSIMILTTIELWVALDKVATHHCKLMEDFSPEIPSSLLEPLLLPKQSEMKRLQRVEQHIRKRENNARHENPNILESKRNSNGNSFGVQYYDSSFEHQSLRAAIERQAANTRACKVDEFYRKKKQYENLIMQAAPLDHKYDLVRNRRGYGYHSAHSRSCNKCELEEQAGRIRIQLHEWPLPQSEHCAKEAVFELRCPLSFSVWRDTTHFILVDICGHKSLPSSDKGKHGDLWGFYSNPHSGIATSVLDYSTRPTQRITFASTAKSFLNTHYNIGGRSFPTDIDTICVNHGLNYSQYDNKRSEWVSTLNSGNSDVRAMCSLQLPPGPYQAMQSMVDNTIHTSNKVIAGQSTCSTELSLHEYEAFGGLRSGHRLQWLNVARELRSRNLTLRNEAVGILFMQAIFQAGPNENLTFLRDSHLDPAYEEFGMALLDEIDGIWGNIRDNWGESISAHSLIILTSRVLSLSTSPNVKDMAAQLLMKARGITLLWARELVQKLGGSDKLDDKAEMVFRTQLLQVTAICRTTYDVDQADLCRVLDEDIDIETAVECAIILHDNAPIKGVGLTPFVHSLIDRDRRLSRNIEKTLHTLITDGDYSTCKGLDDCLKSTWSGYTTGGIWEALKAPNDRWVVTHMRSSDGARHTVHYNILTGKLLIDGSPLKKLPPNYLTELYYRTFGEKLFDVCPGDKGMKYQSKNDHNGFRIYFLMPDDDDATLIIKAQKEDRILELIPHEKLRGDFPCLLVENYAHWIDLETKIIEFRPLGSQWDESLANPRVSYSEMLMRREGKPSVRYLDVRSTSAQMIHTVFKPLEASRFLHITISHSNYTVEIDLPRLKLVFFVNEDNQLESRQFREMVVDENQSIGTLTGLQSRLVLRSKCKEGGFRKVLIPYGDVSYSQPGVHVRVDISTMKAQTVVYHVFEVDTILSRLVGNSSLSSRLYKAYLHACTSHCLPDPLTGRTGTEEALYDLNAGATWSFKELDVEDLDLLQRIENLTPARVFYPVHLNKMQTVSWNDLPSFSQHEEFYKTVSRIKEFNSRFNLFRDGIPEPSTVKPAKTTGYLVERAANRNGAFRIDGFGGSNVELRNDQRYTESRDGPSDLERRVYGVSFSTDNWTIPPNAKPNLLETYEGWEILNGCMASTPKLQLGYDRSFLDGEKQLPSIWCSLYDSCRMATTGTRFGLIWTLSTIICAERLDPRPGKTIDLDIVWTLLAFATIPEFRHMDHSLPSHERYVLQHGYSPSPSTLSAIISNHTVSYSNSAESLTARRSGESKEDLSERSGMLYESHLKEQIKSLTDRLKSQGACENPRIPTGFSLLKTDDMRTELRDLFLNWFRNSQLQEHTKGVQKVLDAHGSRAYSCTLPVFKFLPCSSDSRIPASRVRMSQISASDAYDQLQGCLYDRPDLKIEDGSASPLSHGIPQDSTQLKHLLNSLESGSNKGFKRDYVQDLFKSMHAFNNHPDNSSNRMSQMPALECFRSTCEKRLSGIFETIKRNIECPGLSTKSRNILEFSGLWPRITPTTLLGLLAAPASENLSKQWKKILVSYGIAIRDYQLSIRLYNHASTGSQKELAKELTNFALQQSDPWSAMDYPDWLLLEIENNLQIRHIQAQIAYCMMTPTDGKSSVLQLNMGEGKSSVIVPIISAALATGDKLVRVVVLKPLSTQMFRVLVQKLGGLTNRRIFYMPFNRSIKVDFKVARNIRRLYKECIRTRGILLVQPEHLLSFKLMGLDMMGKSETMDVSRYLLKTQHWLETKARDILDESDEILSVKYQLIYTMGKQELLEYAPHRWVLIHHLFDLVRYHADGLQNKFPEGVEINGVLPGGFPQIRILEMGAAEELIKTLVDDIALGKLPGISFRLWCEKRMRDLALRFIRDSTMTKDETKPLISHLEPAQMKALYLLRGLLAHGVLLTALRDRRWRVDFGLDENRTPPTLLAVPYRAKDCPALRAEFSHPDMAIVLTSMSYYYGHLTDSQLEVAFAELLKSNNPVSEYQRWVGGDSSIPESIRTFSGVNIEDYEQRTLIVFPQLRHRKAVIDFYLSNVVFARDAKEFQFKLSTSGWDLAEERKGLPTTGFSGTNDNRFLLPLSLKQQDDVSENVGTNAKVLSYLLKPENDFYEQVSVDAQGDKADTLLALIAKKEPKIRVILDVGAQLILKNEEVAEKLLRLGEHGASAPQAVVYFDDNDELIVRRRDGSKELLLFSPLAKQLDECYIYLDEAHTRGTDLKFPLGMRAAVTLGPKLTKDRLVQACMRMRQLGDGHTVMYFAPTEVHQKISDIARKSHDGSSIKAMDVLRWTIEETCEGIRHNVPLWASQGLSYHQRQKAWVEHWKQPSDGPELLDSLKETESQPLSSLYGFEGKRHDASANSLISTDKEIWDKCKYFGVDSLHNVRLQEEQEREVAQETEQERAVERPPPAQPAIHSIHPFIERFVIEGREPRGLAVMRAFDVFFKTSASKHIVNGWSDRVLVTQDFAKTNLKNEGGIDEYLRTVNWILSPTNKASPWVIISPYEANKLLPSIRQSRHVRLHVYSPRVTKDMKSFEDMTFMSIPPLRPSDLSAPSLEINIFAGQIFIKSFKEYKRVCGFLGLHLGALEEGDKGHVDSDGGFVSKERRMERGMDQSPFWESPVALVRDVLRLRRKGQDCSESHMERLLQGIPLRREDFV